MEEFRFAAKKHGFNVFETVSNAVIKDASIYSAGLATLASVAISGNISAPLTLISGLSFAISGMTSYNFV